MSVLVEACCNSVDDVVEAEKAGCSRVELCSAISLGGLTPSIGAVRACKKLTKIPIMAMLRPRSGGFCYTDTEFNQMIEDAKSFIAEGVEGLVFGILREDGTIDSERDKELIRIISHESFKIPKRVTLVHHRAFDVTPNWQSALEEIIEMGFDRILTSAQTPNVNDDLDTLSKIIECADNRIEILPGSGVCKEKAIELAKQTGAKQIHLRHIKQLADKSCNNGPNNITFNAVEPHEEDKFEITDKAYFEELVQMLSKPL